jgi:hypothetical protein
MDDIHEPPESSTAIATIPSPVKPEQAKVDAIANLTMACYAKASMLQLTEEETAKLGADFPDDAFRPGAAGKENLLYIEHAFLRDRLNDVFGPGQWSLIPRSRWSQPFSYEKKGGEEVHGEKIYVEAMLLIRGCFVDEAIGDMDYFPKNNATNYGDAVEGAKTQALRRCAKTLGIGLQAWKKGWCEGWWKRNRMSNQPSEIPAALPACPKCGSTTSVIIGKPEYGGGFVCFDKKGGCKHKWSTDTPQRRNEPNAIDPILAEWDKRLDGNTVNEKTLNTEILAEFKKIGGKDPARAQVWAKILKFAETHGLYFEHSTKTFMPRAS